ncbi:MAG: DUF1572 family protein [Anaerolineales bacterium]|jgi:hypothetical protein
MEQFFGECCDLFRVLHEDCKKSIAGLPQRALDWAPGEGMNSIAVMVVHLTGAERYWIGDVAMEDASGRDRASEFAAEGLDEKQLGRRLDQSLEYVRVALGRLGVDDLSADRVSPRDGTLFTVGWAILHALEHTALHTGHMQITRQLWELSAQ